MTDINKKPFTEETELKLDIFKKCFREWFPVFLNSKDFTERVYVYDLFAGSGTDSNGRLGSPLWFLSEARGDRHQYCEQIIKGKTPSIYFAFNEFIQRKCKELKIKVGNFIDKCRETCNLEQCAFNLDKNIFFQSKRFEDIASNKKFLNILHNKRYAKFVVLDQYGVKQITPEIFHTLVLSPKTDFIFFIASSALKRFKNHPAMKKYFEANKIPFDLTNSRQCHKAVADYYKSLLPDGLEYYIHHFTIRKGTNYYGLIFGTGHTLGMEKFLKVCWDEDKLAGESNCNEELDFEKDTFFYNVNNSNNLLKLKESLSNRILLGLIDNNKDGMKFVLNEGCLPKVYVEVIQKLIKDKKVQVADGFKFNKQASNIHKIDVYKIKVL